ncbi:LuxR C-terminal-related transcriptional regulator [Mesorhizobium sp. M1340]|uniref:response regulator transcription factor n=1 Tax=Mesorhizobium sp. M1340 TaxID=2957087 RepID=UPI003338E8F0
MKVASSPTGPSPFVVVVDDDPGVRDALDSLFRSVGMSTYLFGSPAEIVSGLDFQSQMTKQGIELPVVFMTGHGDIPMTVRAMKAGAVDFLSKPFRDQDMLDAVTSAIERDRVRRVERTESDRLRAEYETLTPREREVMGHVVAGLMNKQVAGVIGLSEITVKIHRGNVMRKMGVRTLADLVRKAEALGISGR